MNSAPACFEIASNSSTVNLRNASRDAAYFGKSRRIIPAFTWLTSINFSPVACAITSILSSDVYGFPRRRTGICIECTFIALVLGGDAILFKNTIDTNQFDFFVFALCDQKAVKRVFVNGWQIFERINVFGRYA